VTARAYTVWRVDCDCGAMIEYGEDDSTLPDECEECGDEVVVER
jgi:hypothetical protein